MKNVDRYTFIGCAVGALANIFVYYVLGWSVIAAIMVQVPLGLLVIRALRQQNRVVR